MFFSSRWRNRFFKIEKQLFSAYSTREPKWVCVGVECFFLQRGRSLACSILEAFNVYSSLPGDPMRGGVRKTDFSAIFDYFKTKHVSCPSLFFLKLVYLSGSKKTTPQDKVCGRLKQPMQKSRAQREGKTPVVSVHAPECCEHITSFGVHFRAKKHPPPSAFQQTPKQSKRCGAFAGWPNVMKRVLHRLFRRESCLLAAGAFSVVLELACAGRGLCNFQFAAVTPRHRSATGCCLARAGLRQRRVVYWLRRKSAAGSRKTTI